jgi:CRISPR system Cascade subunit CasB
MTPNQLDPKETAARLMAYLRRLKNDRGAMAALRCALIPGKLSRAWPLLEQVGGIGNTRIETIAGLFAYHPEETLTGNLGKTCRRLRVTTEWFDARFCRLLVCDRDQICERLRPVILAAKAKGIPINYAELFSDLHCWSSIVKARWARDYWGVAEGEELAALTASETTR